jgi:hypothetical protein
MKLIVGKAAKDDSFQQTYCTTYGGIQKENAI